MNLSSPFQLDVSAKLPLYINQFLLLLNRHLLPRNHSSSFSQSYRLLFKLRLFSYCCDVLAESLPVGVRRRIQLTLDFFSTYLS